MNFFFFIATDIYQPLVPYYQTGISLVTTLLKRHVNIYSYLYIFLVMYTGLLFLALLYLAASVISAEQCIRCVSLFQGTVGLVSKARWCWHWSWGTSPRAWWAASTATAGPPRWQDPHIGRTPAPTRLPDTDTPQLTRPQKPGAALGLVSSPSRRQARLSVPCQGVPSQDGWLAPWPGAAHRREFQLNQAGIFKQTSRKRGFKTKRKHQKKTTTRTKPSGCRELTTKVAGEAGMRVGRFWLCEMLRLCL